MKLKLALIVVLVLLFFIPVKGVTADKWSTQDVLLETTFGVLKFIDWRQTRTIAKNPDMRTESNPLLGWNPTVATVDKYFLATAVLHLIITHYLPQEHRIWWQGLFITLNGANVAHNFSIGIRMDF